MSNKCDVSTRNIAFVICIDSGTTITIKGKQGAGFELGASLLGAIPFVGDAGKAILRGGRRLATEVAEESTERVAKEVAEHTAKEATERAAGESSFFVATKLLLIIFPHLTYAALTILPR